MPADRFFTEGGLELGASIILEGAEHHHLSHVMRIGIGEKVEITNGKGCLAKGQVLHTSKKETQIKIVQQTEESPSPNPVQLALPLMRPAKLEWVIEKGTELGVESFFLYPADYSEKEQLSPRHLERLHILAVSALKQSGRLFLPRIEIVSDLSHLFFKESLSLFGDVGSREPLDPSRFQNTPTLFITGPEKGFSSKELSLLNEKAKGVGLSRYILRAETAPIAAASILCTRFLLTS